MILRTALISTLLLTLIGCTGAISPVGNGALMTNVKGHYSIGDGTSTEKTGRACANNVLGLVAFGDASAEAAKMAGDITRVASVDYESQTFLGLLAISCTIVTGK